MMKSQGCEVIHYGVGSENPGADEHIEVLTEQQQIKLLGHDFSDHTRQVGTDADVNSQLYREFNHELSDLLRNNVAVTDIVCLPFGRAHEPALRYHKGINVETGIGYPEPYERFRIFESYAWMHKLQGTNGREGDDYEFVIPNYFDVDDWPLSIAPRKYLAFFGRLNADKGLAVVRAIAIARPDLNVIMCGQGDPSPWLSPSIPNLRYLPPITGKARAKFLGGAIALLAPSRYTEPFCGVTVEANLCGTPALTSNFGAFTETIQNGVNGWRCHTLGDWLAAIEWSECHRNGTLFHRNISNHVQSLYSMDVIGKKYVDAFDTIRDVYNGTGWYTKRSNIGPINNPHTNMTIP